MKSSDAQLQQMFVRATDEVIPPAPWLEAQVADAVQQRRRARRRVIEFVIPRGFESGVRLAGGLAAIFIVIATVAAVMMSSRLIHNPLMPAAQPPTARTPSQSPLPTFTPSPAVRASNWPPGGTVPTQLAGAWQPENQRNVLHLGGYTWEFGDNEISAFGTLCGPGPCYIGNVVVNGSEIDFIDDTCTLKAAYGFERFTYTLTGNTLVLTRAQGPGQSACRWLLAGTYTRVSTP